MATVKRLDLTKKGMSLDKAYRDEDYTQVWDNFLDPATQYARKVLNKEIVAGYKLRLSAFRHVRDIQRSQEDDGTFPYYYDLTVAQKVMLFALSTPNPDTGKPVDLMPWQWYLLLVSKAWRRKDDPKQARFRTGIISVARGQGKTMLEAILMLYSFIIEGDGLSNQDYLVTAPTAVQLTKIWDYMISTANLMRETKEFKPYFTKRNILVQETSIRSVKDRSKIIKISDESGRFESFHASYGVGDEYGETDGQNAGKITSGMMLSGGQFMMISTAKDNPLVPFHQDQKPMVENMEKDYLRERDDFLMIVFEQDSLDEVNPEHSDTWIKSNPLLGNPDLHDKLLANLKSELENKQADGSVIDVITRNFNMWHVDKAKMFLSNDLIEDAITADEFDITGRDVFIGLDYSVLDDDTSISFVFPYMEGDQKRYYVKQHSFIPLSAVNGDVRLKEKQDGINYRREQEKGNATIAQNQFGMIDPDVVLDYLFSTIENNDLKVQFFVYDQYRLNKMLKVIESNSDLPMIALKQDLWHITEPTKATREAFIQGQIRYADDEIITKSLAHAELETANNAIKINKARKSAKIDFVASLIDAMSEATYYWETFTGHTEKANKSVFGGQSNEAVNDWFKTSFSF